MLKYLSRPRLNYGLYSITSSFLSTMATTNSTIPSANLVQAPLSKRAQLRQIKPDIQLMHRLDAMDLGFCAKKRRRIAVAVKLRGISNQGTPNVYINT
jgi:hypothetical protein